MASTRRTIVGINMVRVLLHKQTTIEKDRHFKLAALAHAAACKLDFIPKTIFIRSDLHKKTKINGVYVDDPLGWHATFSVKDSDLQTRNSHVTLHGYTDGKDNFTLKRVTPADKKSDDTRKRDGKKVWPDEAHLIEMEGSPVAYSHPETDESSSSK
ncbi:hypothetical protein E4U21_003101 [Claviceps maximensis]|nr:hypothetical protein E4U21_003101 [Claviceps maximensis]